MRYLIIIILFVLSGCINAQTPKKISSYPAAASFDPEDLFIVADGGTTSKKMTGALIQAYSQLVGDNVRSALADTAIVLRSLMGGDGFFQKSLNRMRPVNINDSLGIGVSPTLGRLHVQGNSYFNGTISTTALTLISGGLIYMNGDEMMFYSSNTGLVTLSSLIGGGSEFSENETTNYSTTTSDNWHFGGTSTTSYKVKITGSLNVTTNARIDGNLEVWGTEGIQMMTSGVKIKDLNLNNLEFISYSYPTKKVRFGSSTGYMGIYTDFLDLGFAYNETMTYPSVGKMYFDISVDRLRVGTNHGGNVAFDTIPTMADLRNEGIIGGGGIVDTTGLPVANRVTYFTSATKIASSANFTFDGDSVGLGYLDPATSGTRFIVLTSNAKLDSGVLNPVYKGLEDPLWNVHDQLADRKNREMKWYHIEVVNGKDSVFVSYGLPQGMDAFEALQYAIEQELRLIAEQDLEIKELTERVKKLESKPPPEIKSWLGLYVFLLLLLVVIIIKK